jgi:hypothetical protein
MQLPASTFGAMLRAMSRRSGFPALLLLSTVWAWLVFDIVCGATAPFQLQSIPAPVADGCCKQMPADEACATSPGCGLTCAALLTVTLSESGLELLPAITSHGYVSKDEFAATVPRCPPVPPPKARV